MTLSKPQLAALLAKAMNALNDAQLEASNNGNTRFQGELLAVIHAVPEHIRTACDYTNNGTMTANDLLR